MSGWALFGYVVLAWISLSLGGGALLLTYLQIRWVRNERRAQSNVVALPDRTNVRVIHKGRAS